MASDVILQVKECDVCRAAIRVVIDKDREVAYDVATDLEHECFEIPEDAQLLVMEDEDCNCGHS